MNDGEPSLTARAVSVCRALATTTDRRGRRIPLDPTALALTGDRRALRALARLARRSPLAERAMNLASFGLLGQVAGRTRAIDDALVAAALDQHVILGAGLDGRAWRLDALRGATVFEVDFPATQALKRGRVAGLDPRAAAVRFVAVDFRRDSLSDRLAEAGHDGARPTAWVWEGVTMYLDPAALEASLAAIAERSADGSWLLVTYSPSDKWFARPPAAPLVRGAFAALGEPLLGMTPRARFHEALESAGFAVVDDVSYSPATDFERLVTARRARRRPAPTGPAQGRAR